MSYIAWKRRERILSCGVRWIRDEKDCKSDVYEGERSFTWANDPLYGRILRDAPPLGSTTG